MGAERWIRFASREDLARAKAYLKDDPVTLGGTSILVKWRPTRLELSFGFGDRYTDDLAMFVSREIARRFPVVKIGADSIGWYADSDWRPGGPAVIRYSGTWPSWAEWVKDYKPEWSHLIHYYDDDGHREAIQQIEASVLMHFVELDQRAS
jgi:hypothetical protein